MNRRDFIALVGGIPFLPLVADADTAMRRVGILAQDVQPGLLETFRDQLEKLGFSEGKNVSIELRNASGRNELLAPLSPPSLSCCSPAGVRVS
jgi:putative tryptophan/tyrosine transport system substrate-binding protein